MDIYEERAAAKAELERQLEHRVVFERVLRVLPLIAGLALLVGGMAVVYFALRPAPAPPPEPPQLTVIVPPPVIVTVAPTTTWAPPTPLCAEGTTQESPESGIIYTCREGQWYEGPYT